MCEQQKDRQARCLPVRNGEQAQSQSGLARQPIDKSDAGQYTCWHLRLSMRLGCAGAAAPTASLLRRRRRRRSHWCCRWIIAVPAPSLCHHLLAVQQLVAARRVCHLNLHTSACRMCALSTPRSASACQPVRRHGKCPLQPLRTGAPLDAVPLLCPCLPEGSTATRTPCTRPGALQQASHQNMRLWALQGLPQPAPSPPRTRCLACCRATAAASGGG